MPAKQRCTFITYLPRPLTPLPLPASKLSRNLDPLRGKSDALGELAPPNQEAETDGGDDGKFHRACPRSGNKDLRQVCRDDMSAYRILSKGLVYRTADHTCDELLHGSLLRGTCIEEQSEAVSI